MEEIQIFKHDKKPIRHSLYYILNEYLGNNCCSYCKLTQRLYLGLNLVDSFLDMIVFAQRSL